MVFRGVPSEMADTLARVKQPFSVWSRTNTGLLTARDYLGITPLFYTWGGNDGWTIGTTVGEILDQLPETRRRLDEDSVVAHVAGPAAPDPAHTFYSRIHAVPPGTLMRFTSEKAETLRYWRPAETPARHGLDLQTAAAELRALVIEVVTDHLPDRPVAISLSSGLGSATVLAALVEAGADVEAITWTSTDVPGSDETRWARRMASKLGVELTELPMNTEDLLPESGVFTRRSTPYFDKFDHMWRVTASTAAELGRDVLYTGFGADHLFGGSVLAAADLLMRLRLGQLLDHLSRSRESERADGFLPRLVSPIVGQTIPGLAVPRNRPVAWLHERRKEIWQKRRRQMVGPGLLPGRAMRISRLTDGSIPQLSEDLTARGSPHGIEMYHPLLDRRLLDFALSLPSWLLDDGQADRLVLREAMRGLIPEEVVDLERVLPGVIARKALRARETQLLSLARNMRAADLGYVDEGVFFDHVAAFFREKHDDMSFWNTLTLEDWLRRWW